MKKIPSSVGKRGLHLLKLAGASIRLARADEEKVARNSRRFLSENMGKMKGLPQKVGQILSMAQSEEADDFDELTEGGEPLQFEVIEQVLNHEWKRPWREMLADIDPIGRAASLGQVHRARLISGEEVAVKVQYPGIAKAVNADLKMLGWLSIPLGGFTRQFNLEGYREEILRDLNEEMDYLHEAQNQHQYEFLAKYTPNLVVPHQFGQYTTQRVLVCAWEEGSTLDEVAATWSEAERASAGRLFLSHALSFFRQGFVHGDLHPGNFRFRKDAAGEVTLLLYDFGCVYRAELEPRLALLRLIDMTEANATGDPYPFYLKLGFNPDYLEPLADKLPALSRVLFEPFIIAAPYPVERWQLGERVAAVLGEDRWNFRAAGPPEMILLMRLFHGIIHALRTLEVGVNWKFAMDPIRAQFAGDIAGLRPDVPERQERSFGTMAKHLKIRVRRDGETKVQLTSPLHVIDNLAETLDEQLRGQIEARNIDLAEIVEQVRRSGYRPQEVFLLDGEAKEVRVWLE